MDGDDSPSWGEVVAAVGRALSGDREGGRRDLLMCWDRTDERHPAARLVLAHYLADLEDSLDAEVAWDERALGQHPQVGPDELHPLGIPSAASLVPSLHLNLGDGYLRQGRIVLAREPVEAGLAACTVLEHDAYGAMVRRGLGRLAQRVGEAGDPSADRGDGTRR